MDIEVSFSLACQDDGDDFWDRYNPEDGRERDKVPSGWVLDQISMGFMTFPKVTFALEGDGDFLKLIEFIKKK